jgi:hypothetical protein
MLRIFACQRSGSGTQAQQTISGIQVVAVIRRLDQPASPTIAEPNNQIPAGNGTTLI